MPNEVLPKQFHRATTGSLLTIVLVSVLAHTSCPRIASALTPTSSPGPTSTPTPLQSQICPGRDLGNDLPVSVTGSTNSEDDAFGGSCGGFGAPEQTFRFTAPRTGWYVIDTHGSAVDTVLYVRDGDCGGNELACTDDSSSVDQTSEVWVSLVAGQHIAIFVDGYDEFDAGKFVLDIKFFEVPSTPDCMNPANVVANCGFETGDFRGWVTQDLKTPLLPLSVGPAGVSPGFDLFTNTPTEGTFAALTGFDGDGPGTIELAQDVVLRRGVSTLRFDYRAGWNLADFGAATMSRKFRVDVQPRGGGAALQSTLILTAPVGSVVLDTGILAGNVDLSRFAGTAVRIAFAWVVPEYATGPAFFALDNVSVFGPSRPTPTGTPPTRTPTRSPTRTQTPTTTPTPPPCPATDLGSELPMRITGSTAGGQDHSAGSCGGRGAPEHTFQYTAPVTAFYTIDTLGSNFDTVLYVLDDSCFGPEVACNDDAGTPQSQLTVSLVAGQSVVIVVDGYNTASGDFALHVARAPLPPPTPTGPACPDVDLGSSLPLTTPGSTDGALNDASSPCGGGLALERTFLYTAPVTATYTIDTVGSAFDTVLYVRDGSCFGLELACNDDAFDASTNTSQVTLLLSAGQSIVIFVDGFGPMTGRFTLNISATVVPSPTATPTGTPRTEPCVGDCDGSGSVTVSEIVALVNVALGAPASGASCPMGTPGGGTVDISVLVEAVNNGQEGCPRSADFSFSRAARLEAPSAGDGPQAIALADLNGDSRPEILAVDPIDDQVAIFLNDGSGGFSTTPVMFSTGSEPAAVTTGDFDGDGRRDVVVVNANEDSVTVYTGSGTGQLVNPREVNVDRFPRTVGAVDLNHDGADDLAVLSDSTIRLLKSNGDGTFVPFSPASVATRGLGGFAIAAGFFDADPAVDLAVSNGASNNVSVLLGHGDGTFRAARLQNVGNQPAGIVVTDLNGDAHHDIAVVDAGEFADSNVSLLFGNGDGTFAPDARTTAEVDSIALTSADLDSDGRPDLVATTIDFPSPFVLENCSGRRCSSSQYVQSGFQLRSVRGLSLGEGQVAVSSADVDGDRRPDVVALGQNGAIGVFRNTTPLPSR